MDSQYIVVLTFDHKQHLMEGKEKAKLLQNSINQRKYLYDFVQNCEYLHRFSGYNLYSCLTKIRIIFRSRPFDRRYFRTVANDIYTWGVLTVEFYRFLQEVLKCTGPIQRTQMTRNVQHSSTTRLLPHLLIWRRHVTEDTPAKTE